MSINLFYGYDNTLMLKQLLKRTNELRNQKPTADIHNIAYPEARKHPKFHLEEAMKLYQFHKEGQDVFVATHSELIVLRIKNLIRWGLVSNDDVHVYWCDNNMYTGEPYSREIRIDSEGDFIDFFSPDGFFEESYDEVFGKTQREVMDEIQGIGRRFKERFRRASEVEFAFNDLPEIGEENG